MEEKKFDRGLSKKDRERRMTLYLNEKKVNEYFDESYGSIDEYVKKVTEEGKGGGGIKLFFVELTGSLGRSKGKEFKAKVSPSERAELVEYDAADREILIDLSSNFETELNYEHILKYKGECRLTEPGDPVSDRFAGLRHDVANEIEDYRIVRESKKKKLFPKDDPRTAVWTATPSGKKTLASILSMTYCSPNIYRQQPHGLLGKLEKDMDDIMYIDPFWVWA